MEGKRKNKRKRQHKTNSFGESATHHGNFSTHPGFSGACRVPHCETFSGTTSSEALQTADYSCDRTSWTSHSQGRKQTKHFLIGGTGTEKSRQKHKKWTGDGHRNYRDDPCPVPQTTHQDSSASDTHASDTVQFQKRPKGWKKHYYQEDYSHSSQSSNLPGHSHGLQNDFSGNARQNWPSHSAPSCGGRHNRHRKWRNRDRGKAWSHDSKSETRTSSATSTSGAASASFDIPGFYYDPEKKKYFKIQAASDVRDGDTNIITNESIRSKEAEVQRQKDLKAFEVGTSNLSLSGSVRKTSHNPVYHPLSSILLNSNQRGEASDVHLERTWITHTASKLQKTGSVPVSRLFSNSERVSVEHMVQMKVSKDHNQLLCLWSMCNSTEERFQLVGLKDGRSQSRQLSLEFKACLGRGLSWNKISSLCWCDFPQYPEKKFVLYTTMCHTGSLNSLAFIRCLDEDPPANLGHQDFNLGNQAAWTSAWNCHKQRFGVGIEKSCVVIDVKTRSSWKFNTFNSDVLAQIFSKEDGGNLMYSGTRKGIILQHDLRIKSANPVSHDAMRHPSSVCCLRLSPDEHYIYASDFKGVIKKWDMRTRREVLAYEGLVNSQCKLPFHIDETQSIVYAAGQDCYTKLWCLQTGKQLLSIPPPYSASMYCIPAVRFSTRWGGSPGNMGLLMGAQKQFYFYSLHGFEE